MIAALAIAALTGITLLLARENRRLTNLLLARNPNAVIAAEASKKTGKKQENLPATRIGWTNPVEAVGP